MYKSEVFLLKFVFTLQFYKLYFFFFLQVVFLFSHLLVQKTPQVTLGMKLTPWADQLHDDIRNKFEIHSGNSKSILFHYIKSEHMHV